MSELINKATRALKKRKYADYISDVQKILDEANTSLEGQSAFTATDLSAALLQIITTQPAGRIKPESKPARNYDKPKKNYGSQGKSYGRQGKSFGYQGKSSDRQEKSSGSEEKSYGKQGNSSEYKGKSSGYKGNSPGYQEKNYKPKGSSFGGYNKSGRSKQSPNRANKRNG